MVPSQDSNTDNIGEKFSSVLEDNVMLNTVKRLMLVCPLFHEFYEPNKTAKLTGANINSRPKQDEITTVF